MDTDLPNQGPAHHGRTGSGGARAVIIRTVGLEKTYGSGESATHALRGVDASIERGEFIAVMGPSGSGKSTFFNMIGALDAPSAGRILIDEVDVAQSNIHGGLNSQ